MVSYAALPPRWSLDPVASLLWRTEIRRFGLPFALRCLATWWRIEAGIDSDVGDAVLAAARRLQPQLQLDRHRGW